MKVHWYSMVWVVSKCIDFGLANTNLCFSKLILYNVEHLLYNILDQFQENILTCGTLNTWVPTLFHPMLVAERPKLEPSVC